MIGIYFSGTGNTKFCIGQLFGCLGNGGAIYELGDQAAIKAAADTDEIIFAYPVYYSNLPKIVSDYIADNAALWKNKRIFILATMGLFSGDGAGCAARAFRKYGAKIFGGLHVKMPDCIGDVKALKRTEEQNRRIVSAAEEKIRRAAEQIAVGIYPRDGLGIFCRAAGLFGQRLYFRAKTNKYYRGIKLDKNKCISCGLCATLCPTGNISVEDGAPRFGGKCTMCYRCFAHCPARAITVIGKRVYVQYKLEK